MPESFTVDISVPVLILVSPKTGGSGEGEKINWNTIKRGACLIIRVCTHTVALCGCTAGMVT